jgi:ABC-type dipeptide/oligopeptide/nickel transport system permease subunit
MAETQETTSVLGTDPQEISVEPVVGRSLWQDAWRRLFHDKAALICMVIIAIYAMIAVGAWAYDYAAKHSDGKYPTFTEMKDYDRMGQGPSGDNWRYWLGTDWSGRSVVIKTMLGAKVSMTVGLMANLIAIPLGMLLGAVAGYYSGRFFKGGALDDLIVWLYSTLASIPGIILLIAMKYAFKNVHLLGLDLSGIHGVYIALGVTSWIGTCRLVRAETMKVRELDYVLAARATGRGNLSILFRHVLPNVVHIGIINFSLGFVGAVTAEVMLSYLGLGVEVGTASWGTMINSARNDLISGWWWELTSAVAAMFFLVLALNILGDRLRDALDPRLKNV